MLRKLIASLVIAVLSASNVVAQQSSAPVNPVDIKVKMSNPDKYPKAELAPKKLFVYFDKSDELTAAIRKSLAARGYNIVESEELADVKLKFLGLVRVAGKGLEPVSGNVGEIANLSAMKPGDKAYKEPNIGADHVAISVLTTSLTSALSLTDFANWLGQQTGVAAIFNKIITGDPRGICMHENCNKYQQGASVSIHGDGVFVQAYTLAINETLVMDKVFAKALIEAIDTFPVVKNAPISQSIDRVEIANNQSQQRK